jgi:Putative Actinobacterial Holin-X, holin superfamily III
MSEPNTGDVRVAPGPSASQRLAGDMADVVRDEVRTVRSDLANAARPAASGLLFIGAAAGLAVLGVGTASVMALRMFEAFLPKTLAAAGLTAGYLAGAAVLGVTGLARLQDAGGGSQRLADQLREALRQTVGRPGQAAASAARQAATE